MSNSNNSDSNSSNPPHNARRGSITDFFARPAPYPGPITTAAAEANQRRRMSISGTSPVFSNFARRGSVSSVSSANSAPTFEEEDGSPPKTMGSAFARRMSFGAKALMDVKTGRPLSVGASTLAGVAGKEQSVPEQPIVPDANAHNPHHQRRQSVSQMPLPVEAMPKAPVSSLPNKANPPDAMQERMLKGDFYMD